MGSILAILYYSNQSNHSYQIECEENHLSPLSYTLPLCSEAIRLIKYMSMTGKGDSFLYGGFTVTYSF
jgi:hypothetical protein